MGAQFLLQWLVSGINFCHRLHSTYMVLQQVSAIAVAVGSLAAALLGRWVGYLYKRPFMPYYLPL